VARRVLPAIVCLALAGCGGTGRPPTGLERVALAVSAANRAAPFVVPRSLRLPARWTAEVWARVPDARFAAWTPEHDLLVSSAVDGSVVRLAPVVDPSFPPRMRVLVAGLDDPQGLAFDRLAGRPVLYVAEAGRLDRFAWLGSRGVGRRAVVARLPDPDGIDRGKGIAVGPDHTVYVGVGSGSATTRPRAVVLAFRPDGARLVFATGVRNAVGLAFAPDGDLWAAVNGENGPDLVARLTAGRSLGWPACVPDVASGLASMPLVADPRTNPSGRVLDCSTLAPVERGLPPHTAPLGFHFLTNSALPRAWSGGAVIAAHGSFANAARPPAVLWLPWTGDALGPPRTLATGFQLLNGTRWGRPVDAVPGPDGALYVTDDDAGAVYRLVPPG
jgi:glucose/arabinose dehydrogenase